MRCISTVSKYVWEISHPLLPQIRAVSHTKYEILKPLVLLLARAALHHQCLRHEPASRAVAAALLAKGSLTGNEAHRIFNRAGWPAAALQFEATILTLRDQLIFALESL
jgi:hypothetical protein